MEKMLKNRHIGLSEQEQKQMLQSLGVCSIDELVTQIIPTDIRLNRSLELPVPMSERDYLEHITALGEKNHTFTSYIGMGWYDTIMPAVIQRNVFENPTWYTSYTPYQAEISQGRLEALLNFQTAVSDFTGLPLANASLLDEATAAAEAVSMAYSMRKKEKKESHCLFVDKNVFPQTLAVISTRAKVQGIEVVVGDYHMDEMGSDFFAVLVQYPNAKGSVEEYRQFAEESHRQGYMVLVAADILSLALLSPPGEWGADVVFGSTQRWGIPMYYGGPSAGYFATKEEYKRNMPGRIIGVSKDAYGKTAFRMALQTREQHIKREKATSNICTAQALLATMASFYTVYHGASGIREIANAIHSKATYINEVLQVYGFGQENENFFDTLKISLPDGIDVSAFKEKALKRALNFWYFDDGDVGLSIDETTTLEDINELVELFADVVDNHPVLAQAADIVGLSSFDERFERTSPYLSHHVFGMYHTETELMRYIKKLERRDISLTHSMISLGSCTMKLTAAAEMLPMSNANFANMHPLAPQNQAKGYLELIENLSAYLSEITGLSACSLQPNSGASGEFTGLLMIKSYYEDRGEAHRNIVLIPASAHGTNPASAVQCGYTPVVVDCNVAGDVDIDDWIQKAEIHKDNLAACMITYPSTHGIFEKEIRKMCDVVHRCGGQVYMDGANMNAQVGWTHPGVIGADVCHLNLHKTFAIPHGGGGPGVGPICVARHLSPFLPATESTENRVSAAPYGSAGVLMITYGYIRMMGAEGLKQATGIAILNANYLAHKLKDTYGIVYSDKNGWVGHELILECRNFKNEVGVTETDIAKRLMDYGYHAPTLSFPVHGTLMIEPTESESLMELERFVAVLQQIFVEIKEIEQGIADREDNVLKNAPHPEYEIVADEWRHCYGRLKAAYPMDWVKDNKFWINVARVDNAYGDRNLFCTCPPISDYK